MRRDTAFGLAAVTTVTAASVWERIKYSTHDRLLKTAGSVLDDATSSDASIYTDHISPRYAAEGQPPTFGEYIPDIVVHDFPTLVVAEVETAETLDSHAREQLEAFQRANYATALIVPGSDVAEAEHFVETVDGDATVTTADDIAMDVL